MCQKGNRDVVDGMPCALAPTYRLDLILVTFLFLAFNRKTAGPVVLV